MGTRRPARAKPERRSGAGTAGRERTGRGRGIAELAEFPNVGPATLGDLKLLGITRPSQLRGRDPVKMYEKLCRVTGARHDPCCLDVFMAVVDFAETGKAKPWWAFTAERKRLAQSAGVRRPKRSGAMRPRPSRDQR